MDQGPRKLKGVHWYKWPSRHMEAKVMDTDSFNVVITTPEVFLYEKSLYALVLKKGSACLSTQYNRFMFGQASAIFIESVVSLWDGIIDTKVKYTFGKGNVICRHENGVARK